MSKANQSGGCSFKMKLLIKNGRLVDPANNLDEICDLLVENFKISKVAKNLKIDADNTIDATGKIVIPGLVDMHVHLREPGREDKETVATGIQAGLCGGVTSVLAMPNTQPPIDCPENIQLLKEIIKKTTTANVFIAGTITRGRRGQELTDIAKLKKEGALAITDDGVSVESDALMLEALKKAREEDVLVICHCEDKKLSGDGQVNLGIISTRMGLRGISKESEYKRVARDIELAKKTKAKIHIAHISCKESVELIAKVKRNGVNVTCEATPHHFTLDEEMVLGFDTNFKMKPPLRNKDDVAAIKQALSDGTIDVIASDHAPHTENEKEIEFQRAEFGVVGLETELAVAITELINTGLFDWSELVRKISYNPAQILGLKKGRLSQGADADIVIVFSDKEWVVKKDALFSKSKNSPFLGKTLKGIVEYTICGGRIAYKNTN
jgi:dihydroorotase